MLERRHHKGDCEIRTGSSGNPIIAGYAAVFGKRSHDLGGFVEDIHPGAFERTLRTADVRALANHDANMLLGRSKSGTLRLGTDTGGLHYEIDPNMDDPTGRSAVARVERGDWDGSSFSFRTVGPNGDRWEYGTDPAQRTLLELELYDVGPVTFPAYPDATSVVRGAVELLAQRESRSVDELATALQSGSLRQLLDQAVELPAVEPEAKPDDPAADHRGEIEVERERIVLRARAAGIKVDDETRAGVSTTSAKVAWGPDDGFQDLLYDVDDVLNPAGWRYWAADISLKLDKVLIWDWSDETPDASCWVAPLKVSDAGEPTVGDRTAWVLVEAAFVVVDMGRALRSFEARAKTLLREVRADGSGADRQTLLDTMNIAAQSFIAGCGADTDEAVAMQEIIASLNELSEQMAGPNPADASE